MTLIQSRQLAELQVSDLRQGFLSKHGRDPVPPELPPVDDALLNAYVLTEWNFKEHRAEFVRRLNRVNVFTTALGQFDQQQDVADEIIEHNLGVTVKELKRSIQSRFLELRERILLTIAGLPLPPEMSPAERAKLEDDLVTAYSLDRQAAEAVWQRHGNKEEIKYSEQSDDGLENSCDGAGCDQDTHSQAEYPAYWEWAIGHGWWQAIRLIGEVHDDFHFVLDCVTKRITCSPDDVPRSGWALPILQFSIEVPDEILL